VGSHGTRRGGGATGRLCARGLTCGVPSAGRSCSTSRSGATPAGRGCGTCTRASPPAARQAQRVRGWQHITSAPGHLVLPPPRNTLAAPVVLPPPGNALAGQAPTLHAAPLPSPPWDAPVPPPHLRAGRQVRQVGAKVEQPASRHQGGARGEGHNVDHGHAQAQPQEGHPGVDADHLAGGEVGGHEPAGRREWGVGVGRGCGCGCGCGSLAGCEMGACEPADEEGGGGGG
jgi:hypothetical protein